MALLAAGLILAACGDGRGVRLELQAKDEGSLALDIRSAIAGHVHLVAGRPWQGHDVLRGQSEPLATRLAAAAPEAACRLLGSLPIDATQPIRLDLPAALVDEGETALQAYVTDSHDARDPRASLLARSSPAIVTRAGSAVATRGHGAFVLRAQWRDLAAIGLGLLAVAALRVFVRMPRAWPSRGALAALVLLVAGGIVLRATRSPAREFVDEELAPAPLVWPGSWPLAADPYESTLGPGFRVLLDALRQERRGSDAVTIRCDRFDPRMLRRASYLSRLVSGATVVAEQSPPETGLVVDLDLPAVPGRELIAASPLGSVWRQGAR